MSKSSALIRSFIAFTALYALQSQAATIYLKADAQGDGTGSSWSNACTTYRDALAKMREVPREEPASLLIAKGLYSTPSSANLNASDPTVVSNLNFTIAGGYRAQSDGDLVRDPEVYQTILTGLSAANLKKATWTRLNPVPGEFRVETTDKVLNILDANECLQFPEYIGEHDTFKASTSTGYIPMYIYGTGTSGTVDGLKFVCFNRGSSRSGIIQAAANTGPLTFTNCVFAGSDPQGGSITLGGAQNQSDVRIVADCKFMFNRVSYGTLGVSMASKGISYVRNCSFIGSTRQNNASMCLVDGSGGDGAGERYVEDCVFARNMSVYTSSSAMIGSGLIHLRRCVITNNYASVSANGGSALLALSRVKNSSSGNMIGCLVADNYSECKPSADSASVFVNLYGSSQDSNASLAKDCLFRGNKIYADATGVSSGYSFAVGVVGNSGFEKTVAATVIGSTFDSNTVAVVNLADGATARKSRGIVVNGSASKSIQYGVANCTFTGPRTEDIFDILQYNAQYDTMNIVNCIFTDYDSNAMSSPFSSDAPDKLYVYNSSVKNMYPLLQPTDCGAFSGVTYDPIPLETIPFGVGDAYVYRPAAKVPDIRVTCDVATNSQVNSTYGVPNKPLTFAFRLPNGDWQSLTPKAQAVTDNEKTPLEDCLGTARAFGSYTRGAVQNLKPVAETGVSLTLRTDPALVGSFSSTANQSVAAGSAITPVTVTSDNAFLGWYNGDTLYSSANPLEIASLNSDLVLTAKFVANQTEITFNLGPHGIFDDNGGHSVTVMADAGSEFPEVPSHSIDDGWIEVGWPDFPAIVPDDAVTYTAKVVTKAKRTFYVAPVATGTGDGSSPENAIADFAAAYADAGSYVGEVRLAAGVYRIAIPVAAKSNVAVVGPGNGLAIISGDVNGDDCWKTNGTAALTGPAVWNGSTFTYPEPPLPELYWQPAASVSDNTANGFVAEADSTATNMVFRNVVFTGFGQSAFFADLGADVSGLEFDHCRFLANGTAKTSGKYAVNLLTAGNTSVRDCDFIGNFGGLRTTYYACVTTDVERCTFACNTATCLLKSYSSSVPDKYAYFNVRNSVFTNNYSDGTVILTISSGKNHGPSQFTDNRVNGNYGVIVGCDGNNANDLWPNVNLEILRCEFTGNRRAPLTGSSNSGLLVVSSGRYYPVVFRDCYVADNVCTNNGSGILGLSYVAGYNRFTYINCTFERNHVISTANGGRSAILCGNNPYLAVQIGASLMTDNEVTALLPENAADLMMANTTRNTAGGTVVGCVIDESKYGQLPVRAAYETTPLSVTYSAVRGGIDPEECGGVLSTNAVFTEDAMVMSGAKVGPNGVKARGLSSLTPCRTLGIPFFRSNNDCYYFRRPGDTKFQLFGTQGSNPLNDAAAALLGLSLDGPFLTDAWGQTRRYGKIAPGPLNPPKTGLTIICK